MSDIGYGNLTAAIHGAVFALIAWPLANLLFWRLTCRLEPGPRALRPFVAGAAALGLLCVGSSTIAAVLEPASYRADAMDGTLLERFPD